MNEFTITLDLDDKATIERALTAYSRKYNIQTAPSIAKVLQRIADGEAEQAKIAYQLDVQMGVETELEKRDMPPFIKTRKPAA